MNTVLVILAIVIVTLFLSIIDWHTALYRWRMLRAKQQLVYLMYTVISLLGVTLLTASMLVI